MVGWCDHILTGIAQVIDERYRDWLNWPFEQARRIRVEKVGEEGATIIKAAAASESTMPV